LDFDDAFALVAAAEDADALGSALVSDPHADSMIATAAAIAAVPEIAVRFTFYSCQ